jgi:hypothetical protein
VFSGSSTKPRVHITINLHSSKEQDEEQYMRDYIARHMP